MPQRARNRSTGISVVRSRRTNNNVAHFPTAGNVGSKFTTEIQKLIASWGLENNHYIASAVTSLLHCSTLSGQKAAQIEALRWAMQYANCQIEFLQGSAAGAATHTVATGTGG